MTPFVNMVALIPAGLNHEIIRRAGSGGVMEKQCSHGKTWDEPCKECDKVSFEGIALPMLKRNCQHAAEYFTRNPGFQGPDQIVDLYKVVAHLLTLIEKRLVWIK